MNNYIEIMVLVEGKTEKEFISGILKPYLLDRNIFVYPTILTKPGEKGGDIKFVRAKNDIRDHLRQRSDTYVTLFIDYYGTKSDWPGLAESKSMVEPIQKATLVNRETLNEVKRMLPDVDVEWRFVPNIVVHEFEGLLFSDSLILAKALEVKPLAIDNIVTSCGSPEKINDSSSTAPSKRLGNLSRRYKKTITGTAIAKEIGIDKMRQKCPVFNQWLDSLENLASNH